MAIVWFCNSPKRGLEIVLTGGVLSIGEKFRSLPREMVSAPQEISGGPHLPGIDMGLGNQSIPQQCGNFFEVDLVVLAFAAMDCPHIQGMAKNERDVFIFTNISKPVPGKHAFS